MKYEHKNAQEICQTVDPNGEYYGKMVAELKKSSILPDFVLKIGKEIASKGLYDEDLATQVVVSAETIYAALKDSSVSSGNLGRYLGDKNDDALFITILDNLFYPLEQEQFESIVKNIGEIYETDI